MNSEDVRRSLADELPAPAPTRWTFGAGDTADEGTA
jgi:hypothetical protein